MECKEEGLELGNHRLQNTIQQLTQMQRPTRAGRSDPENRGTYVRYGGPNRSVLEPRSPETYVRKGYECSGTKRGTDCQKRKTNTAKADHADQVRANAVAQAAAIERQEMSGGPTIFLTVDPAKPDSEHSQGARVIGAGGGGGGGGSKNLSSGAASPYARCDAVACQQRFEFEVPRVDGAGQVYIGAYISTRDAGGWMYSSKGDNRSYFQDPGDCTRSRACLSLDFASGTGTLIVNYSCDSDGCYDAWALGSDENNISMRGDGKDEPFSLNVHATNSVNGFLGHAPLTVDFGVEVKSDAGGGGYVEINSELYPSYEFTVFGEYYSSKETSAALGVPYGLELHKSDRFYWLPSAPVSPLPPPIVPKGVAA